MLYYSITSAGNQRQMQKEAMLQQNLVRVILSLPNGGRARWSRTILAWDLQQAGYEIAYLDWNENPETLPPATEQATFIFFPVPPVEFVRVMQICEEREFVVIERLAIFIDGGIGITEREEQAFAIDAFLKKRGYRPLFQ